jgi:hypothetical protein
MIFLLKVVVCNIPGLYQILGDFFCLVLYVLIEIHRDLKLFELFRSCILETISNFLYFLKSYFEKMKDFKIIFSSYIQTYASLLAK